MLVLHLHSLTLYGDFTHFSWYPIKKILWVAANRVSFWLVLIIFQYGRDFSSSFFASFWKVPFPSTVVALLFSCREFMCGFPVRRIVKDERSLGHWFRLDILLAVIFCFLFWFFFFHLFLRMVWRHLWRRFLIVLSVIVFRSICHSDGLQWAQIFSAHQLVTLFLVRCVY